VVVEASVAPVVPVVQVAVVRELTTTDPVYQGL